METHIHKLSNTRAGERSRIWLEGRRLAAAGFKPGSHYLKVWGPRQLTLRLCTTKQFNEAPRDGRGLVSGKGDKPIIDIVGVRVVETFKRRETVEVIFDTHLVTIRG